MASSARALGSLFLGFRPAATDFSCLLCWNHQEHFRLPLPALMIAVMRWQSSGQDVDKLKGGHLSRAIKLLSSVCICPGAWRHPFEVMNNDAVYK